MTNSSFKMIIVNVILSKKEILEENEHSIK